MTLQAFVYSPGQLSVLNQLLLPLQCEYEECHTATLAHAAIKEMKVRGAPAIANVAVLALACEAHNHSFSDVHELQDFIFSKLDYLCTSRPTAVNLFQMAHEMKEKTRIFLLESKEKNSVSSLRNFFIAQAEKYHQDDLIINQSIGAHGAAEIMLSGQKNFNILTHCNTGSLATSGFGTALGVVRDLFAKQRIQHVYATETRPYLQGARLTAFELVHEKIPSTLIADNMVSFLMKNKKIDAVIVGADRVAANGDTANKIGTYQIAIAAQFHGVPFYVAAPTPSIDLNIKSGDEIHIEERPAQELIHIFNRPLAADGIGVWNPSFDVTPAHLIRGIITEHGVAHQKNSGQFDLLHFVKNKG